MFNLFGFGKDNSKDKNQKAVSLYNEAEKLKKNSKYKKAINKYWDSIKTGEKSNDWKEYGPAPAMYRKLAKLYYHREKDKKAIQVLDRYIKLANKHNQNASKIKKLRKRLANGDFRRLTNKYS